MFDSVHIGLSGLQAFSKGLKVVSNNVANLNTPGFKSTDLRFGDLYYQAEGGTGGNGTSQLGTGVSTLTTFINFTDGETRQTGNPLDLSIDGTGFFVTRDAEDHTYAYTRAGQFEFDKEGLLVSRSTGRQVMGYAADGSLGTVSLAGLRMSAPTPTTTIRFRGNLSTGHEFSVDAVHIVDAAGVQHTVSLKFRPAPGDANAWTMTLVDGTVETPAGDIAFVDGAPAPGSARVSVTYSPAGADPVNLSLDFSDQVTSFAAGTASTLGVSSTDGSAAGTLTQTSFDDQGVLTLRYSNGQTAKGPQLALARFESNDGLEAAGAGEFVSTDERRALVARAASDGYGKVLSSQVEGSNVDLASEFSDLIVMQRGYQASSRIVSTANEMLQELFDMKGKR
jgi:flagellar hook protein FlgE